MPASSAICRSFCAKATCWFATTPACWLLARTSGVPPAAEAVLGGGGARLDLEIEVQGYGKGRLAIISA